VRTDAPLPLMNWQADLEADRLRTRREELLGRISKLRPHAHRRLALQERLMQTTTQLMELENQLAKGRRT